MEMPNVCHQKPLVYGVMGFVIGAAVAVMGNTLRQGPAVSTNSAPSSDLPTGQLVSSPQSPSVSGVPHGPGWLGRMAHPDQHFIVMMIPHHEDAVAMADLALTRATHPELKKLAAAIKATQTQEIGQMRTWYQQWYGTAVPAWTPGMGMGMMRRSRQPALAQPAKPGDRGCLGQGRMATDLVALQTAADFDREFITQMIPHHQMAVMMAAMVADGATHPEVRQLAQSIRRSQTAEIEQMQQWYQTWYPQQ
jgi:uncharacterized protein (DUF305 family)